MPEKTLVLRKDAQWYVVTSDAGDEREILLTLLEYSEKTTYNVEREDVLELIDHLGYRLEVHEGLGMAG
jgi:hypothetical protein